MAFISIFFFDGVSFVNVVHPADAVARKGLISDPVPY
jgi:hypothetical protein